MGSFSRLTPVRVTRNRVAPADGVDPLVRSRGEILEFLELVEQAMQTERPCDWIREAYSTDDPDVDPEDISAYCVSRAKERRAFEARSRRGIMAEERATCTSRSGLCGRSY